MAGAAAANLALGVAALAAAAFSGRAAWIEGYFRYAGTAFLIVYAALELILSRRAFRLFSPGDALRPAWLLISLAAAARLGGFILSELLAWESPLRPAPFLAHPGPPGTLSELRRAGLALGGPGALLLLSPALALVGRAYDRHGLSGELKAADWLLLGAASFLMVNDTWDSVRWSLAHEAALDFYRALGFLVDPLLLVLLFQALTLRRAALNMAGGLIGRCWGCYSIAVFLTLLANVGQWAAIYGYLPRVAQAPTWYAWFLVSTAFASGPAYQAEAIRRARRGLLNSG